MVIHITNYVINGKQTLEKLNCNHAIIAYV